MMSPHLRNIVGALFCFAALIGWGQSSDRLLASTGMGLLLVIATLSPYRIQATPKARSRANDLTLVVIALSSFWFYLQQQNLPTHLAIYLLSACPLFLYPKLIFGFLQVLDVPGAVHAQALPRDGVALARHWMEREFTFSRLHLDKRRGLNFQDIYFFLAVFTASFSLSVVASFVFSALAILLYCITFAWIPRYQSSTSFLVAILVCGVCLAGAIGGSEIIRMGQDFAEDYYSQIWNHRPDSVASANSTETSIGRRGRLDHGNKLVMRLEWPTRTTPSYLRNGIFSYTPNGSAWYASPPSKPVLDKPLLPSYGNSFVVPSAQALNPQTPLVQAKISMTMSRERSALALPIGSHEIFGLPLAKLDMNPMGVPTTSGAQGFVRYGVTFSPSNDGQPKPDSVDIDVPLVLIPVLDQFLDQSKARGLGPAAAAAAISSYFKSHWTYTLNLQDNSGNPRTLARFLLRDHEGHCEYFATATTLALRRLGFPARYATGYLVNEFDERENLYWIRTRDAHAWSSVWTGSSWSLIDSTPGGPPESMDWSTTSSDILSRFQYMIEDFDPATLTAHVDTRATFAIFFLMMVFLAYRLRFRKIVATGDILSRDAKALSIEISRLSHVEPWPTETSFDYWLRMSPLFSNASHLQSLALSREQALFMPTEDRTALLTECEKQARTLRRQLRLAPITPSLTA